MRATRPSRTLASGVFGDVVIACFGFVVAVFAFGSRYSETVMTSSAFRLQYWHSVYASRVLGRELTVAVDRLLTALGHPNPFVRWGPPGLQAVTYFSSITIVNFFALITFTVALSWWLRRSWLSDAQVSLIMLCVLGFVTASLYVVTPYDVLSFACMVMTFNFAFRSDRWNYLSLVFVVLGCLTRESEFVAIALIVAVSLWRPDRVSRIRALSSAAISVATYVVVHTVTRASGGVLDHGLTWYLSRNLHGDNQSFTGILIAVLAIGVWNVISRRAGISPLGSSPDVVRIRLTFLALVTPYLFFVIDTGRWYESLRLIIPVLLADVYVATLDSRHRHDDVVTSTD